MNTPCDILVEISRHVRVLCGNTLANEILDAVGAERRQRQELEDALLAALPYVEDALTDEGFKKGAVAKHVAQIRAALKLAEGSS